MAISDTWLKSVHKKAHDAPFEKTDREGMSARVSAAGKVVFQLRFRYQGKAARMDLGTYPGMTLKQARDEALLRRTQLEQGYDPRVLKKLETKTIATAHSNESLLRLWYDRYCKVHKKGHAEILRSLEIHVMPELGDLPAKSTTVAQWMDVLEPLAEKRPRIAERVLANVKQAHKWACRRELMDSQPLAAISAKYDLHVHRNKSAGRALSDDELRLLWKAMNRSRMAYRSRLFIKLCLVFGCRPGELRTAAVSEFDFENKVWTIPAERHKTGQKSGMTLRRPIIDEVVPLIKEAMMVSRRDDFLFSGEQSDKEMNERSILCFPYSVINVAKNNLKEDMDHWSMYDLRKTARTNWGQLTNQPHVCELMLGHRLPGMWQVYDKYDYLDEQAEVYRAWWKRLTEILGETPIP